MASKRAMRKYYHDRAFPSSDVDLFLYGLTAKEAERKIITIYEAVRDSIPWDVTCVRTKHTISIHSQYPYRSVQIVLRLYSSPAEILAGFDVDAPCCAYDGDRVWANPRAIVSMMRQSNTVDMTRRSPSYEVRLAKYSSRGFEIYVPGLKRKEIDPTIYERAVGRVQGLARLLAIEKLATPEARSRYQHRRSVLRGRPTQDINHIIYVRSERRYKCDLKAETAFSGLEMSDYDIVNLHIPYGPGWDAKRIEKLIYKTDFGANSPYNPKNKNRSLHRHSAFFGIIQECMEDCCEHCPEPQNEVEHNLQDEEDKSYVRGRIAFIEEDPGRQSISGSFNPIDEGEWSESAYVQATAKFFGAITNNDTLAVTQMIEDGEDVNRRDHVGRTPLQVAILSNSVEVARVFIVAGARMTARLVGGRTSFHLAAQMGQVTLIKEMLAPETAEDPEEAERVRMSSEDDWSSEESDDDKPSRKDLANTEKDSDSLEDNEEEPDVLDLSMSDWDFGFTALGYAILYGSLEVVEALLAAGADPNFAARAKEANPLHPLILTIYTQDEERAAKIAERLVAGQAISSTADENCSPYFITKIVASLLTCDANAKKVLDIPAWTGNELVFPIVSAILAGDYATLSVLLTHGAKLVYLPEDVSRAEEKRSYRYLPQVQDYKARIHLPIEVALAQRDEVVLLLAALGATVDVPIKASITAYTNRMSLLQWCSRAVTHLWSKTVPGPTQVQQELPTAPTGDSWSQYRTYLTAVLSLKDYDGAAGSHGVHKTPRAATRNDDEVHILATRDYYANAESVLRAHGATLPGISQTGGVHTGPTLLTPFGGESVIPQKSGYTQHINFPFSKNPVPVHLKTLYDELYEACWAGDNAFIQELCLPKRIEEGKTPIQISVQTEALNDSFASEAGWTPFFVALYRRHWETARLVLAISAAQYQPPKVETASFDARANDSDSDDEGSYDSDEDYAEEKEINFIDIAARPSAIRTDVSPKWLLEVQCVLLKADGKSVSCKPLQKAIIENDFEAFVRTLDLYQYAGVPIRPDDDAHSLVVALDRPEMLDELTRRSGVGIPIPTNAGKSSNANPKKVIEERVYLGLKVGGKRRAHIVQQGQTQRKAVTYNFDLLRHAIRLGATKVVEYLASPRPLAAYKYYAATHNDDIAQYLKSFDDNLEAALPGLLGWQVDELNESPLLCAVVTNRLDVLKQLFALKPNLMKEALHQRVKFIGFNALLAAAYYCSSTEIVNFLLEKGCDPSDRDARGWNIYHLACLSENNTKRVKFIDHLLKTLPKELTHELMVETSSEACNTPLMLAVKRGHTATTRAILRFGIDPAILLLRDADGSTPLHRAVQNANTVLAEILLEYGPTELLYMENSVGQTPLDIASLKSLPRMTGHTEARRPNALHTDPEKQMPSLQGTAPFNVEKQKVEIPKLRATLDTLFADGRLVHGTKLATELLAFVVRMEGKLAIEIARKNAGEKEEEAEVDPVASQGTATTTYFLLRDAAARRPGFRKLVHLADVRRSVQRSLAQQVEKTFVSWSQHSRERYDEFKEADPEEQRIAQLKARSLFASSGSQLFSTYQGQRVDLYGEDKY
ncbi:hypothetical protein B0F90DRAFT_1710051 [Multifurca ochricompacta]|uniref:Ankyrin repeat protein n=1 Tax=Multifurca ochricompacta TaxID=376703 RepID=A0AAD4QPG2_9AGAM|nr:hypothetical protein B0F90DRAFT_1710051 [Multifurca ochricompacta]